MRRIMIAAIFINALLFVAFQGAALSADSYDKQCTDQKSKGCHTSIDATGTNEIFVTCSWPVVSSLKTYKPGSRDPDPPTWNITQGSYRCEYETQIGAKMIVCKGYIGVSPDVTATFTEKEFLDAQTRCSRVCHPCPNGSWK